MRGDGCGRCWNIPGFIIILLYFFIWNILLADFPLSRVWSPRPGLPVLPTDRLKLLWCRPTDRPTCLILDRLSLKLQPLNIILHNLLHLSLRRLRRAAAPASWTGRRQRRWVVVCWHRRWTRSGCGCSYDIHSSTPPRKPPNTPCPRIYRWLDPTLPQHSLFGILLLLQGWRCYCHHLSTLINSSTRIINSHQLVDITPNAGSSNTPTATATSNSTPSQS